MANLANPGEDDTPGGCLRPILVVGGILSMTIGGFLMLLGFYRWYFAVIGLVPLAAGIWAFNYQDRRMWL